MSGVPQGPGAGDEIDLGDWDVEDFDLSSHVAPPDDLEEEEPPELDDSAPAGEIPG